MKVLYGVNEEIMVERPKSRGLGPHDDAKPAVILRDVLSKADGVSKEKRHTIPAAEPAELDCQPS